jgi:2-oxoisovalerate dehydrogenase E1 component alpha subunit
MTYRRGHHSTSDDSARYRPKGELDQHNASGKDPISRLGRFLKVNSKEETEIKDDAKNEVLLAIKKAEKLKRANIDFMFKDVYAELPKHLQEQNLYIKQHISNYKQRYPQHLLDLFRF